MQHGISSDHSRILHPVQQNNSRLNRWWREQVLTLLDRLVQKAPWKSAFRLATNPRSDSHLSGNSLYLCVTIHTVSPAQTDILTIADG
jgi:hypothetical protein